ncbi:MAG: hypothetical protein FJY65_12265 [Calditrichaeota bacterium]|nr:hypothetical protein [Calditrichota bacterium]
MSTKVADMTIEELTAVIRRVIREELEEEELREEFALELEQRAASSNLVEHTDMWDRLGVPTKV